MIETLILGALAVAGAFITGYLIGKDKADYIRQNYFGWEIKAFKSPINDTLILDLKKEEKRFSVLFDLAKSKVDWFIRDAAHE